MENENGFPPIEAQPVALLVCVVAYALLMALVNSLTVIIA